MAIVHHFPSSHQRHGPAGQEIPTPFAEGYYGVRKGCSDTDVLWSDGAVDRHAGESDGTHISI